MAAIRIESCTLEIDMTPAEGWLVRLLGLVERRGFEVEGVSAEAGPAGRASTIRLTARPRNPERTADVLIPQLRRLYGVHAVRPAAHAMPAMEKAS